MIAFVVLDLHNSEYVVRKCSYLLSLNCQDSIVSMFNYLLNQYFIFLYSKEKKESKGSFHDNANPR